MMFIERNDEPVDEWTPDQEALAAAVTGALRAYIKSLEALTKGKYEHLRDKLPTYLVEPGNTVICICKDGIVVRFEKKHEEQRKLAVMAIQEGIGAAAATLSQNLVHIESEESPRPPENFGVEFKLSVLSASQHLSRDLVAARIWFQAKKALPQQPPLPGAKPYCLLSVRNQLTLEIFGELCANGDASGQAQPFVARSTMRLQVGWECVEVFPGTALDAWKPEAAPMWAEYDLLGAALVSQTTDAQLSTLDPRASARRLYAALLNEFKLLLDSTPENEQVLQTFLQQHPHLLCPTQVRMWPKLPLGPTVTDFVFRDANQQYLLVEIEHSDRKLFRQDGQPTALTHAQGQVLDWRRYIEDNLSTVQRELGLVGITSNANALVVIGRSHALAEKDRRKLKVMANESPKLRLATYDDVYASAKAVLENLLGPIWDTGGATEIYYPAAHNYRKVEGER